MPVTTGHNDLAPPDVPIAGQTPKLRHSEPDCVASPLWYSHASGTSTENWCQKLFTNRQGSRMDDQECRQCFDVTMPQWYRKIALVVRMLGAVLALACVWLTADGPLGSLMWPSVGMIAGFLTMVLPSFPKAYIEQRKRTRERRDGGLQEAGPRERGR